MDTRMIASGVLCGFIVGGAVVGAARGELVTFQNTNPELASIKYFQVFPGSVPSVLGQALDVTHGAFEQPEHGDLPGGSFVLVWFEGRDDVLGDWIYMAPGFNSHVAQADEFVDVIDPYTHHPVGYLAPGDFDNGELIGESTNWADSWVTMHTSVSTAPSEGIYFTDASFTLGVRFALDDGVHYGFAELKRTEFVPGDPLSIRYQPVRWGYETTAGVPVPGVGSFGVLMCGIGGAACRRR